MRRVLSAVTALLALGLVLQAQPPSRGVTVTYLANEGVLLSSGPTTVMIDGLFGDGLPDYARLDGARRAAAERALGPFEGIDLLLVTHWHDDHFDPQAVGRHLLVNPTAAMVSSLQVTSRMQEFAGYRALKPRIHAMTPEVVDTRTFGGAEVAVLRLAHNPSRRFPEQHVGFLVTLGGVSILHVGDAEPSLDNFAPLAGLGRPIDVALLPYWYALSDNGRKIIDERVRPEYTLFMHVPPADAQSIAEKIAGIEPAAVVLREPMERHEFVSSPAGRRPGADGAP